MTGPVNAGNSAPLTGLLYGAATVFAAPAIGSLIVTTSTLVASLAVMYLVNAFGLLCVSTEGEAHGLDHHEQGIPAFPE